MDNNKPHFLLMSITDHAQNPWTMGPRGRNCGCLGGPQGRIPAPRPRRARTARVPRQVLPQGAKTRVQVFADIQNFALCARHSNKIKKISFGNLDC